jgi:hypothetical protein
MMMRDDNNKQQRETKARADEEMQQSIRKTWDEGHQPGQ